MNCPKCGSKMDLLLFSHKCPRCEPPRDHFAFTRDKSASGAEGSFVYTWTYKDNDSPDRLNYYEYVGWYTLGAAMHDRPSNEFNIVRVRRSDAVITDYEDQKWQACDCSIDPPPGVTKRPGPPCEIVFEAGTWHKPAEIK